MDFVFGGFVIIGWFDFVWVYGREVVLLGWFFFCSWDVYVW